jgi:DNA polymerase III epsilon subunit-like protein
MRLAREIWKIRPTDLRSVCETLGIPLVKHHHALEDAKACAGVVLRALKEGHNVGRRESVYPGRFRVP